MEGGEQGPACARGTRMLPRSGASGARELRRYGRFPQTCISLAFCSPPWGRRGLTPRLGRIPLPLAVRAMPSLGVEMVEAKLDADGDEGVASGLSGRRHETVRTVARRKTSPGGSGDVGSISCFSKCQLGKIKYYSDAKYFLIHPCI